MSAGQLKNGYQAEKKHVDKNSNGCCVL